MSRRISKIAILVLLMLVCMTAKAETEFRIDRGVNIAHWLSQSNERGAARDSFFVERDIRYIVSMGLDHVRIPIDEEQMFTVSGEKDPKAFSLLHTAIGKCIEHHLRVIVDLHILRSHHFNASSKPLFTESAAQQAFYDCWRKLSSELSQYPTDMVAYELMNEPVADNHEDWNKIANECYQVVRALEPKRVIVLGSNRWQSFDTVKYLKVPEGDPNIIISFHYYNPMLLTHYRASWTNQKDYKGPVHYPGKIVSQEEFDEYCPSDVRNSLKWNVGKENNAQTMRSNFQDAVDVARKYGLQVYCGEFGCLSSAPKEDRMRWHRDMEKTFSDMGIAHAIWCYREGNPGFGLLKGQTPDQELVDVTSPHPSVWP